MCRIPLQRYYGKESCKGVLNALEVCKSSDRLIGIALSGGDYTKDLQTVITGTGVELQGRCN